MEIGPRPPEFYKKAKRMLSYAGAVLALGATEPGCNPNEAESASLKSSQSLEAERGEVRIEKLKAELENLPAFETNHAYFDNNPDFFKPINHGTFSDSEKQQRTERLPNGALIFHDIGLDFYKVKPGDSIGKIKHKLTEYAEYAYLNNQRRKIISFNIPDTEVPAGDWIPIPLENKDRHVSDLQFAEYSRQALLEILDDPKYASDVADILDKISISELQASMIAIAKQESSNSARSPIGTFGYHKYEPKYHSFSYGPMHILMSGDGLTARHNLNMSEGQVNHPKNAVKLFLAFMVEKSHGRPEKFFPLDQHAESFATFYNGKYWKSSNPNYADNIGEYYKDAMSKLSK